MVLKHHYRTALALLVGVIGGVVGAHAYRAHRCGGYRFVNEDYACGEHHAISKAAYSKLENDVRSFVVEKKASGAATEIGVYFRDLRDGGVFGVNENADFVPASLLKLPLVVTYFAIEERQPGLLQTQLAYRADTPLYVKPMHQTVSPPDELRPGESYPVEMLMQRTLQYSDNTAYSLLAEYLNNTFPEGRSRILLTFHELGVIDPRDVTDEVASVRNYSAIFRSLYNVSYLPLDASEKILTWLVDARFPPGLVAGVPTGTQVADKFGERQFPDGSQQVHDCGIVYFPDNPYLLCIMTKGRSWEALTEIISRVSRMVYAEVDSRRK